MSERFPIVGVGASAGGLRALQRLFGNLPPDTGMAFVVIVHLDPSHESQMAELLQSSSTMPVSQVTQSLVVEPNHVYIIPPDRDLGMVEGELRVSPRTGTAGVRTPIDLFFRTLADMQGPGAIGVILSGTGSDGTQGVRWIKERGGLTMVQEPADAEYDGMPRSAVATGLVDVVLPADALAQELARLRRAASTIVLPAQGEELQEADASSLQQILLHVRSKTGRDFTGYKPATVLRRLERRMQFAGTQTLADYLRVLQGSATETNTLFNDFLISVTSFFRDAEAFETLEREVVPAMFAGKGEEDDVRVWVAGCATGEEAYSLAILLSEHAEQLTQAPRIQIFATDVHEKSFAFAREGLFPEAIRADISPERLARFFTAEPGGYRVKKSVREKVLFATHDVLKDPPFLRLDLVSCRNVLIYLQPETQRRLLELFHYALRPGGHLFLGSSESADAASSLFTAASKKWHIYRSLATPHAIPFRAGAFAAGEARSSAAPSAARRSVFPFGALHQQLVEAYAPPSLVVNADQEVVHVSSQAGRFLRLSGGVPTTRLLDLVQGDLRVQLRALLQAALRTGAPAEARGVRCEIDGRRRKVRVSVRPLPGVDAAGTFLLVVFDEEEKSPETPPDDILESTAESTRAASLEQLEQELKDAKAQLAATSEEHEATIEELRASNEELQSITEEQRAVAEELEASKEELQSINEELRTINQEHRIRNEELAQVNADLVNLIDSTDIGTVFLDRALRIRRFTPPVADVFNFVATDVGRPFSHVTHRLDYPDLEADLRDVLRTRAHREREVTTSDGNYYVVRLAPYVVADDAVDGVVLTLVDTTDRKLAELEREVLLQRAEEGNLAKSNFISAMSHEFGTPLHAILGYADVLRLGTAGPVTAEQREKIDRISHNAWHLVHLVEEILAAARSDRLHLRLKLEPVDLAAVLREVETALAPLAAQKGLALRLEVSAGLPAIESDATKLHQILINLLGNAVRYTDQGHITLRARMDATTVIIEVEDTGIGIEPEHLERIFQQFWQVDQSHRRVRGGAGLGLMVSRNLARALGGDIEVESRPREGSVFRLRLPRTDLQRPAPDVASHALVPQA